MAETKMKTNDFDSASTHLLSDARWTESLDG